MTDIEASLAHAERVLLGENKPHDDTEAIHGIVTKKHITVASALVRGLYFGHFTFGGSRVQGPERSRRALVVTRCEADSGPSLCSGSRFRVTPGT